LKLSEFSQLLEKKYLKSLKNIMGRSKEKEALINKFIETSPKIAPVNGTPTPAYFDINKMIIHH
jgi:hypothetical protein